MAASDTEPIDRTDPTEPDPASVLVQKGFLGVLVIAGAVGVLASLVAWLYLEAIHEAQHWIFTDLPEDLGFDSAPLWWYVPILALAGLIAAFAIERLPGRGGHQPAHGLHAEPTTPNAVPGVALAAFASIGFGIVLGPEAPLIAIGGGLGIWVIRRIRSDASEDLMSLIGASGVFAAVSFLFGSPLIAAVILLEASGLDGRKVPLVFVPGLMAAGIGSLVSIGMGDWTGVDTSAISLDPLPVPDFPTPGITDFLWTVPLAAVVAIGAYVTFRAALRLEREVTPRPFVALPISGLAVAGLAILFAELTDKGADQVLFSGQEALGPLIEHADTWGTGALVALIVLKGLAYMISLAGFRGGPVFPAMFIGVAGGLLAAELPGFDLTPAIAVALGAAVAGVLRLPLAGVVLGTLLTAQGGLGAGPLVIVGVVVSYLVTLWLADRFDPPAEEPESSTPPAPPQPAAAT